MRRLVVWLMFVAGATLVIKGAWLPAKAATAQVLLKNAWARAIEEGGPQRPWPWADTWPVARLTAPGHGVDLITLAGSTGNALAFGPGHVSHSGAPGTLDTVIIGAHRGTHFAFLAHVRKGDELVLTGADGERVHYFVEDAQVANSRASRLRIEKDSGLLALVTCYPFDALQAGGPLRYVVTAKAREVSL